MACALQSPPTTTTTPEYMARRAQRVTLESSAPRGSRLSCNSAQKDHSPWSPAVRGHRHLDVGPEERDQLSVAPCVLAKAARRMLLAAADQRELTRTGLGRDPHGAV